MTIDVTSPELTLAEIYEITLVDDNSTKAYWTAHDADITYNGKKYQAVPTERDPIRYHTDLQIDRVTVKVGVKEVYVGNKPYTIAEIIRRGFLRNAKITVKLVDYRTLADDRPLFEGNLSGELIYNSGVLEIECHSRLDLLTDKFPKLIYSEHCPHKLFGEYCELLKSDYKEDGTTTTGSTVTLIYSSVFDFSNQAEGYWERGEVRFITGDNASVSGSIEKHYDGYVQIMLPFPETVVVGDAFSAYPGCDKTGVTCDEKYNNYENFFGFEYVPKPSIQYG